MAKKVTSQDLKKKLQKGEEEVLKLKEQEKTIREKIQTQILKNREIQAEYVTLLMVENDKSLDDLEDLLLKEVVEGSDS
ncbi:hypothetical protein BI362_01540 [Streptococcus parauberis]|uniref:Uncharacterized protein n=1 Tax=Streptococcus parauberis TaxID=1348 RepID=A0AAE4HTG0_9STRE|nr:MULTISPECIES: hypothetical protein [Streptococcus]MCK1198637.1 hypothetical protein [Streptococcus uberis]MDT2731015.1 hypothetical protein [Streptococcus parauberis]MDT2749719.1 hypothetical protein [Streptococcus parauberis]OHY31040.1 hypothetical protein BI362_01540 [Streptococcus parauberis]QGH04086.1 hypothetical protein EA458_06205 [Streptococcus dysgalactiae subsp. dysgalactiae]